MPKIPKGAQSVQSQTLTRQATVYLVIQEGGSSGEHYPSFYNTMRQAERAGTSHRLASYRATPPIPVPMHFDTNGKGYIAEDDLENFIRTVRDVEYDYQA